MTVAPAIRRVVVVAATGATFRTFHVVANLRGWRKRRSPEGAPAAGT